MNIFQKVKTLWTVKGTVEDEIKEAKEMDPVTSKPGWKTSTFWVKIFTVDLPVLYTAVRGFLPADVAVKIEIIALGVYAVYRAISETMTKYHNTQVAVASAAAAAPAGETASASVTIQK